MIVIFQLEKCIAKHFSCIRISYFLSIAILQFYKFNICLSKKYLGFIIQREKPHHLILYKTGIVIKVPPFVIQRKILILY